MTLNKLQTIIIDLLADIAGGFLIAIGAYNFAEAADFPFAGITGIALVINYFFDIPIGLMTLILNIPIALLCARLLGKVFMLKSLKTMAISTFFMDVIAPLFPKYEGNLLLASICLGVLSGLGYALIYMRDTSTGGSDFVIMSIRALKPHLSLGKITAAVDCSIVLLGGILMNGNVDMIIYGLIATYLLSAVLDKVMYGMDAGKLTLVVTDHGYEVAEKIDELTQRGATLLKGEGSYSRMDKHVVMCACSSKQMHMVKKAIKEVDNDAFLVIAEASQVRGKGFKPY